MSLTQQLTLEANAIRRMIENSDADQDMLLTQLDDAEGALRRAVEALAFLDKSTPTEPRPTDLPVDMITLTGPNGETATMLRSTYDDLFAEKA